MFGLRKLLDGCARKHLLELRPAKFEVRGGGVQLGPGAITCFRGCESLLQQVFHALILCAPELDIAVGAGQVRAGLGDLLLPRTPNELVESRLRLRDSRFGFAKARAGPCVVLAQDELAGGHRLPLRDEDLEYRFVHLGDEFYPVGCEFPDDDIVTVRVVACGERQRNEAGNNQVSWMHPLAPLMP